MKFVANLNLKGHQFLLLTVHCVLIRHDLFSVYLWEYFKFRNEIRGYRVSKKKLMPFQIQISR